MTDITQMVLNAPAFRAIDDITNSPWSTSPFHKMQILASKSKGSVGEKICGDVLSSMGFVLEPKNKSPNPKYPKNHYDLLVNQHHTEVKLSFAWNGEDDKFTWQQIRSNQMYDRIIFIGINKQNAHCWWATKEDLETHIFSNDKYKQHGGREGNNALYWIQNNIPSWFRLMSTFGEKNESL